jgi:hypothetical protein
MGPLDINPAFLKQLQVGPGMNPGSDRGSFFQKLLNFLSSKDAQKLDKDGNIIPTSKIKPTWGTNLIFKNQEQVVDAINDPTTILTNEKSKNPGINIVNKIGDEENDEDNWFKTEDYYKREAERMKEASAEQFKRAMLMRGVDIAGKFGEGGMRAADSYDNLTRSIAAIAGALPQYNNPGFTISPMAYQNYAFGRG